MSQLRYIPLAVTGLLVLTITTGCSTGEGSSSASPTSTATASASSSASTTDPASQEPGSETASATASSTAEAHESALLSRAYPADTTTASSLSVIVNKKNPLNPSTYAPDDLQPLGGVYLRAEASQAAQRMFDAATAAGAPMTALSGYRSYETQQGTYANWVAQYGAEQADVASARPGYSEHQTGLALDIGDGTGCDLQPCFKDTAAAIWAADHAHEYGFVIRYPWWEHETTGYWYESWHLRYIGQEQAKAYKASGAKTLEEFYGLPAAPTY